MKKLLFIILLVIVTANFISCGGGGTGSSGSATGTTGKTKVTINLGETKTVSKSGGLKSTSSIPAAIASIKFTISAPDMATIVRVITLVSGTDISETFEIPMGPNRHFVVEAMDAVGNILYRGDLYADLTGTSAALTIAMISVEEITPVFLGLSNIDSVTTTSMVLSWLAATDNVTPSDRIQYLIYISTTPGGQDFTNPNFVTTPGAITFFLTGLNPNTRYYIVVRAKDERGNADGNSVEKAATTLMPPDTTAPTYAGIVSATALSKTEIGLSWNPASDDRTAASDIIYLIYMATSSHGQNLAIPSFTTTGTTSRTVTGLNPGVTYYFIVRAKDKADNIDGNTVEKSATTFAPPIADLQLSNVQYNPDPAYYELSGFRINNIGNADAVNVEWVVLRMNPDGSIHCSDNGSIGSIPAGSFTDVSPGPLFMTNYCIVIDPLNTVPESNKGNNSSCGGFGGFSTPPSQIEIYNACVG